MSARVSSLRDDALKLYLDGLRNVQIATRLGVSRERIRQLRSGINSTQPPWPKREWRPITDMAGVSDDAIRGWVSDGLLIASEGGLVKPSDVRLVIKALRDRKCEGCARRLNVTSRHQIFCAKCGRERQRYNYPFLSESAKEKQNAASLRWAAANPEASRQHARRASYVYQLVQKGISRKKARSMARSRFPKETNA